MRLWPIGSMQMVQIVVHGTIGRTGDLEMVSFL